MKIKGGGRPRRPHRADRNKTRRRGKAWVRWSNQRRYIQKAQHKYQNDSIFLILPRNYTKVIVESLWWLRSNCKQGLKAQVHFYQKSKGGRGKDKNTHTGSKVRFPCFSKSEMESRWHAFKTNWTRSRNGPRLKSENLRRGCQLQDRGAVQGRSGSLQHVVARHRKGKEAWLARGGIREHEAFFGSWNDGPSRAWTWWHIDGWWAARPRRSKGRRGEGPSPAITTMLFWEFAYVYRLSVSITKVASEY